MGWSGGNDVVEPVINGLIRAVERGGMLATDAEEMLYLLIRSCQGRDWDTEEETLGDYLDLAWVVKAFARAEVYVPCGAKTEAESLRGHKMYLTCELPRGHLVDHRDEEYETEWPVATEGN
jgi:hypothetical protein